MTKEERKERDQLFCELLFETESMKDTCEQLGITLRTGRKIQAMNTETLLDMVNGELAAMSYKAVGVFKDTMDSAIHYTAKTASQLKAAEGVLDRIGASRKSNDVLEVKSEQPIILMPVKEVPVVPLIKISTEEV